MLGLLVLQQLAPLWPNLHVMDITFNHLAANMTAEVWAFVWMCRRPTGGKCVKFVEQIRRNSMTGGSQRGRKTQPWSSHFIWRGPTGAPKWSSPAEIPFPHFLAETCHHSTGRHPS